MCHENQCDGPTAPARDFHDRGHLRRARPARRRSPADKDVKALLDRIDDERDRFEDQLDGKLKRSILRGPRGEVDVERYLDDLQDNIDRLKGRFKSDYAASAEVTAVLRQASDIHRFMATQPPDLDGASEWNRLSASFGTLATAYGTRCRCQTGTWRDG